MSAFDILTDRGVARLCHFTKLQSLTHILSSDDGILASSSIRSDVKTVTDIQRYDGELDYVCCSIEYPNSWFLNKAKQRNTDQIFKEWVVLYINLGILKRKPAKFCPCNATIDRGRYIFSDPNRIETLFASPTLLGWPRTPAMLRCCPTDDQAEILIKNNVPLTEIKGVVAGNADIAGRVSAMLKTYEVTNMPIYISPEVLSTIWSGLVRSGQRPFETIFNT